MYVCICIYIGSLSCALRFRLAIKFISLASERASERLSIPLVCIKADGPATFTGSASDCVKAGRRIAPRDRAGLCVCVYVCVMLQQRFILCVVAFFSLRKTFYRRI